MIVHYYYNRELKDSYEVDLISDDGYFLEFSSFKFPPPSLVSSYKTDEDKWIDVKEEGYKDTDEGRLFFFRAQYL